LELKKLLDIQDCTSAPLPGTSICGTYADNLKKYNDSQGDLAIKLAAKTAAEAKYQAIADAYLAATTLKNAWDSTKNQKTLTDI